MNYQKKIGMYIGKTGLLTHDKYLQRGFDVSYAAAEVVKRCQSASPLRFCR